MQVARRLQGHCSPHPNCKKSGRDSSRSEPNHSQLEWHTQYFSCVLPLLITALSPLKKITRKCQMKFRPELRSQNQIADAAHPQMGLFLKDCCKWTSNWHSVNHRGKELQKCCKTNNLRSFLITQLIALLKGFWQNQSCPQTFGTQYWWKLNTILESFT